MLTKAQLSNLFKISRPRFYSYLFGPFVVGAAAAIQDLQELNTPIFYLLLLYFLFPANLFLYGINDIFDRDTDQLNQKKGSKEHLLQQKELSLLRVLVISIFVGTLILTYVLPITPAILLLLFLLLSTFYSAKPIRFKARPVV